LLPSFGNAVRRSKMCDEVLAQVADAEPPGAHSPVAGPIRTSEGGQVDVSLALDRVQNIASVMSRDQEHLSALDSAVGDSDHGANMARGSGAAGLDEALSTAASVGEIFVTAGTIPVHGRRLLRPSVHQRVPGPRQGPRHRRGGRYPAVRGGARKASAAGRGGARRQDPDRRVCARFQGVPSRGALRRRRPFGAHAAAEEAAEPGLQAPPPRCRPERAGRRIWDCAASAARSRVPL